MLRQIRIQFSPPAIFSSKISSWHSRKYLLWWVEWNWEGILGDPHSFVALFLEDWLNIVLYWENWWFNFWITIWERIPTVERREYYQYLLQVTAEWTSWAGSTSTVGPCLTPPDRRSWSSPTRAPGPVISPGYSRSPMAASPRYSEGKTK